MVPEPSKTRCVVVEFFHPELITLPPERSPTAQPEFKFLLNQFLKLDVETYFPYLLLNS